MVELNNIRFLFKQFTKVQLPNVTLIVIDCVNYKKAKRAFEHCRFLCDFGEAKILTHFDIDDPFIVKIPKISSINEYNTFVIKNLADYFATEHVLIAQWDGYVWDAQMWTEDFLKYDYIGAPWRVDMLKTDIDETYLVGNGGFSLRSKKLQTYLKNSTSEITENEDVIICQLRRSELEKQGFKYAPLDIATKFSWEWAGNPGRAFGQHGHSGKIKALRQRWLNAYRATQLLRRLVSLNTPWNNKLPDNG